MELKDKARAKEARRAAKRTETRGTKGPEIAWDEAVQVLDTPLPPVPGSSDDATDAPADDPAHDPAE